MENWERSQPETPGLYLGGRRKVIAIAVADEVIAPRSDLARSVDTALQEVESAGTIVIVRHIVFARPKKLDRDAGSLCDVCRFDHVVVVKRRPKEPPARSKWMVMSSSGMPSVLATERGPRRAAGWSSRSPACRP